MVLNVGYGIVETIGGFLSGSQALKADALDFLGDGLITSVGLLAVGWTLAWRADSRSRSSWASWPSSRWRSTSPPRPC